MGSSGGYSSIIMIVLMLVIFYLFLILPENKKKKKLNLTLSFILSEYNLTPQRFFFEEFFIIKNL